jgi:hypothetical protein
MTGLKVLGIARESDAIIGKGIVLRAEFDPLITTLIRADHKHRVAVPLDQQASPNTSPLTATNLAFAGWP